MSDGEQVLFEYSKRSELGNQDQRHTHEDRPAVTARTLGRRLAATSSGSIVAHALDFVSVKAQIHPYLLLPHLYHDVPRDLAALLRLVRLHNALGRRARADHVREAPGLPEPPHIR